MEYEIKTICNLEQCFDEIAKGLHTSEKPDLGIAMQCVSVRSIAIGCMERISDLNNRLEIIEALFTKISAMYKLQNKEN